MGSQAVREINTWRTVPKLYMKCVLAALHDEGLRGGALYEAFASMIPAWRMFASKSRSQTRPRCSEPTRQDAAENTRWRPRRTIL